MIKNLLETITRSICEYPNDIKILEFPANASSIIEIHVNKNDYGKMIGKHGKVIQAIRTLVYTISFKYKKRYNIEIVSDNKGRRTDIIQKENGVKIISNKEILSEKEDLQQEENNN